LSSISVSGSGNIDPTIYGKGTVIVGNGNDRIDITGVGKIIVGSGHDTLTLGQGGVIYERGASGHDTINIGSGNATIYEQGYATIHGAFGTVTVHGHGITIHQTAGETSSGSSHSPTVTSSSGHDTVVTGAGQHSAVGGGVHHVFDWAPRQGGMERNPFEVLAQQLGGQHIITNFISSAAPVVHVEGHTLSFLAPHHDISTHGGNTYISMDGGKTSIELQGVTTLKLSDITSKH
jgi:hypothetical protein